jgi:hypothetical protein
MPRKLVSLKVYEDDLMEFQQLAERIKHQQKFKKDVSLPVLFSGAVFTLEHTFFNNEASPKKLNS